MPATLVSSTPQPVYATSGRNFAPSQQIKELGKPDYQKSNLCDALKLKYDAYKEQDTEPWREILETGRMVANLRTGKLLYLRNAITNQYMFVKRDSRFADNKTVGGLFQFYSTKLTAEWLSSRPERDPICPSNDDRIEEFISGVKTVQDYYDTRFFDDNYETQESLSAQDYGTWITRFRYDPDIKDIVCELLDFPACKWDMRFRAEESSFFIYESKCATSVLKHLLDADVSEDGDDTENYGLQLTEMLAKQGGNTEGWGKERPYGYYNTVPGEMVVTEMWLQPEAYCDIVLDAPEKTLSGQSIKGDLLDTFPKGMVVVGINGMRTIIGIYDENHKEHIVSGVYHLQSFSGVGKGISDAVDPKKNLDDLYSQGLAHARAHGTPSWGYDQNVVTEEQARNIGKPRKVIPFDFNSAPDGMTSINQAVQALVPNNHSMDISKYQEVLRNDLQMAFQVTDFSNGLPGVDNKTATGAQIGDANAQMILVPQHRNKADHRKRADKVIYNLFRKFVDKKKFFSTRGKNHNGITNGIYLSGNDFADVDIDFEIVANSEVPQTPLQQQMAMTAVFQQTGGVAGFQQVKMTDPELAAEVSSAYGAKMDIPRKNDIARVCRRRIEQGQKLIESELQNQQIMQIVTGEAVDNSNLSIAILSQLQPPIYAKEPYHPQKVEWLSDLLDTDEMMYAPREMRDFIGAMIDRHIQVATLDQMQKAQDQNTADIMANLPMILGQEWISQRNQMMMAQQSQAEAERTQQTDMATRAQEAQISSAENEASRAHDEKIIDKQHKNALQLQKAKPATAK